MIARAARVLYRQASTMAPKHSLPSLPYAYNALEPSISEEIMTLHHSKHHQVYVNGLNAAEEAFESAVSSKDISKQVELQQALKFHGGGHLNHSLFWRNLAPTGSNEAKFDASSPLGKAIERDFGSFDAMKKAFNAATAAIQGSGWGWLVADKPNGTLRLAQTKDQDPITGAIPIIGVDIWEHAFYLQYKNVKPDYLNAIWNVINFQEANNRYTSGNAKL